MGDNSPTVYCASAELNSVLHLVLGSYMAKFYFLCMHVVKTGLTGAE